MLPLGGAGDWHRDDRDAKSNPRAAESWLLPASCDCSSCSRSRSCRLPADGGPPDPDDCVDEGGGTAAELGAWLLEEGGVEAAATG